MTDPRTLPTIYATVRQSALIHPDWTPEFHRSYLENDAFLDLSSLDPSARGVDTIEELIAIWITEFAPVEYDRYAPLPGEGAGR